MKTEYTILWIDDDPDSIESDIDEIKEFLEGFGIEPKILSHTVEPNTDPHELIMPYLENKELDLILMDFKMPSMNGQQLIDFIRDTDHIYLPVIFYSANGVAALYQAAQESTMDGIYFSHRDRLAEKTTTVLQSLLVKEHTTKRTRGLLMEGVSEIDAIMGSAILTAYEKLDNTQKNQAFNYFREKCDDRISRSTTLKNGIPDSVEAFPEFLSEKILSETVDTSFRWKMLKLMIEQLGIDRDLKTQFIALHENNGDEQPLIGKRNIYAHKTRQALEVTHTDEDCVVIRKQLRGQSNNIAQIEDWLDE